MLHSKMMLSAIVVGLATSAGSALAQSSGLVLSPLEPVVMTEVSIELSFIADVEAGAAFLTGQLVITLQCSPGQLLGDMNCDGVVNEADCDPLLMAIEDPVNYAREFEGCDIMAGDLNHDGVVDGYDAAPFCELIGEFCVVCCPCDWVPDWFINSQDLFDFLTDFFEGDADFNHDKVTNSQDVFEFLHCFFDRCR